MLSKLIALKNHQGFRRYATNTSWVMAEKTLRMIVALFVGIWVVRNLGPNQFGLLSYAQSLAILFTAIAGLGLDRIVVRELVKDETRRDKLLGSAFSLKLLGALVVLPLLALAVQYTSNDRFTNLLVLIIASASIFQSFNVIDFYYQSKVLSKFVALANSISLGVSSVIKIILILNEAPLIAFAVVNLFDSIVLAIGLIYFYKKTTDLKIFNWHFDFLTAKSLLKTSWPLALSASLGVILQKNDQVMIKEMLGAAEVGHYAAAARLSEAWYFVAFAIANSVFPAVLNAQKMNNQLYMRRLQRLYDLMVILSVLIAIPVTFLSHYIILIVYGKAYSMSAAVLSIHIWTGVFVFLSAASGHWFITNNLQIFSLFRNFLAVLINVVLNYLLIPIYGIQGAAISLLIAVFFATYVFTMFDKRTRPCFKMQTKALIFSSVFKVLRRKISG